MEKKGKLYVQYGCGLSAPESWTNFDVSPSLIIQKIPVLGNLVKKRLDIVFPKNVRHGNIIKGLPVADNSCDGLYCSHTLEHLSLDDFRTALRNSYRILKPGGLFRCVVPDLEYAARTYLKDMQAGDNLASIDFVGRNTLLGQKTRPRGIKNQVKSIWGNSRHLWMWDNQSLSEELAKAGFQNIKRAKFNDSEDPNFKLVEDAGRFENAVAIECRK